MRTQALISLVAAGLALAAHSGSHAHGSVRKSLSFGQDHPRAGLRTLDINGFTAHPDSDPVEVATALVRHLTEHEFVVRKDSYTDKATGVTHVYFRQRVNGIEVADGDVNVNVKDGLVLSYGNSFYRGAAPAFEGHESALAADPHSQHCDDILREQQERLFAAAGQTVLGQQAHVQPLTHLQETNCAMAQFGESIPHAADPSEYTAEDALLRFMHLASTDDKSRADIRHKFDDHKKGMYIERPGQLLGTGAEYYFIHNVPGAVSPVKGRLAYVQVVEGEETVLRLVHKFEVEMQNNWYDAAVSATLPHKIVSVVDWASDAALPDHLSHKHKDGAAVPTYHGFAWGVNDPSVGERSVWQHTPDVIASPAGWHALPVANDPQNDFAAPKAGADKWRNTTTTYGNNVFAHENWEGRNAWLDNYRPDAGKDLKFDFHYAPKESGSADALEEAKKYINATVTQLFVTSNLVHDMYYRYGFDEVAGNFQQHNFGRGGRENDGVIANAQDGSGYNNANFMTPPDGQNGRCRMYLWNTANPYRDGDLEAGIVIHELSHGLSTRLTGGPADSSCLGWGESGGMGEGWGDFLATSIRATKVYSDYAMGEWAANRPGGIRNFVYSTNETVNPSTYKTLDGPGYWGVHAIGEVWAQILWVVQQRLIKVHGFSDTLFPPAADKDGNVPDGDFYRPAENITFTTSTGEKISKPAPRIPKHGNTLAVQLVFDGMKLQPCRPSFFDARDAIIQADVIRTGGENVCELWRGFASRGLGPDARVIGKTPWGGGKRSNDDSVPAACKEEKVPEKPKHLEEDWVNVW